MTDLTHIAAPLRSGRLQLKNRIVHAAILTRFAENERATERLIAYHANRARGGAAMIITEAVNALPMQAGRSHYLNAHSEAGIDDLARLADVVHVHDCRVLAQLQERGRGNYDRDTERRPVAPSALPDDLAGVVPRALTTTEVEQMIDDFAAAAHRLERAGFDGVEISAGHGHLFHQFLSAHANHRTDRFGGDLDGRITFLRETISAVRSTCGAGFVVALKLPAEDGDVAGIDLDHAAHIAQTLATPDTVDIVAFAWGAQNHALHWHVPDAHTPRVPYADKIAHLRASANGVPVMALGRIVDPNEAEAVLAAGQADLVGLGRALIADPDWPQKALSGRSYAIRACVSCNTCWGATAKSQALVCDTNTDVGGPFEVAQAPTILAASDRRRVVIIGGGVAGMAAAASAAAAGHNTIVLHRGREIGGRAALAASLPGGDGLQGVYDFDAAAAQKAGARIELGVDAQVEDIIALVPDNVVLATEADAPWPLEATGDPLDDSVAPGLGESLRCAFRHPGRMGGHLVLVDREDSIWCYRAAQYLATRFDRVTVLSSAAEPAAGAPLVVRQGLLERLAKGNLAVRLGCNGDPNEDELAAGLFGFFDRSDGVRHRIDGIDALTHASPRKPRLDLVDGLTHAGITPIRIGDALKPRDLVSAVKAGRAVGRSLHSL
ncbi:MAG: FAD-binding protein [Hyphomicrobiaceae bacterium]